MQEAQDTKTIMKSQIQPLPGHPKDHKLHFFFLPFISVQSRLVPSQIPGVLAGHLRLLGEDTVTCVHTCPRHDVWIENLG